MSEVLACRVDLDGVARALVGEVAPDLFANDKGRRFIARARASGVAFDWELETTTGLVTFHGLCDGTDVLVVGSRSREDLGEAFTEIARINTAQANEIRSLIKQVQSQARAELDSRDELDEMMQLNNELASLQRDATRRGAELHRLNDEKNTLLGMVVHDLRNPLTTVSGAARMLLSELTGELNDDQTSLITSIQKSAGTMLDMVNQLLDLSAIEAGTIRLNPQRYDLAQSVREHLPGLRALAAGKGIDLLEALDERVIVLADEGKVNQVVENLVTNALKYSFPETQVLVSVFVDRARAVVTVEDQGQGIPAAALPTLFEPFTKAPVQTTAGEPSTGLGLAIVKRIVEAHEGVIEVASAVDEGSVFRVELPLARSRGKE